MSLQYRPEAILQSQHREPIVCLSFSSDASFLACGSLDGKLTIWSCKSGKLLIVVSSPCSFLSMEWVPRSRNLLFCGLESGSVVSVKMDVEYVSATGYHAHRWPVECVSLNELYAATGSFQEVKVWRYRNPGSDNCSLDGGIECWDLTNNLGLPRSLGENRHAEVIVTSLQWADTEYSPQTLLVTYLHHGVVFWDLSPESSKEPHCLSVISLAASSCISPDHHYIAISNLTTGFDIYDIGGKSPVRGILHGSSQPSYSPVSFVHDGFALLGGTAGGIARIWDTATGHALEPLVHKENDTIWAVSAYNDVLTGRILAATSAKSPDRLPYVVIWKATDAYAQVSSPTKKDRQKVGYKWPVENIWVVSVIVIFAVGIASVLHGIR